MATHTLAYAPEDPVCLVEACRKAIEWILITHTTRGRLVELAQFIHLLASTTVEALQVMEEAAGLAQLLKPENGGLGAAE